MLFETLQMAGMSLLNFLFVVSDFVFVVLDLAVIAALVAFIPSVIYFYKRQRNKANASINLIHEYAKLAKDRLENNNLSFEGAKQKIQEGNPYGEKNSDYAPLFFYEGEGNLPFEQIREIFPYLSGDEQKLLLNYFDQQSTVNAILSKMNTDVFRAFLKKRKIRAVEILIKETKKLHKSTNDLIEVLNKRNKKK